MLERYSNGEIKVIYNEIVESARPFILCCIVKGIDLHDKEKLKKFFQIQTKIHESEICGKREKASIGTHDLSKIASSRCIHYTVKTADNLRLIPLGRVDEISASELITTMKGEAEMIRKVDRRKTSSGIYKYLHLVDNRDRLACLEDAYGNVISLPPLVNSEMTKISSDTSDVFVEITSSTSMVDCMRAMEELLKEMLLTGFGTKFNEFDIFDQLRLEPVRIVDSSEELMGNGKKLLKQVVVSCCQ